jgi:hypothetical protein
VPRPIQRRVIIPICSIHVRAALDEQRGGRVVAHSRCGYPGHFAVLVGVAAVGVRADFQEEFDDFEDFAFVFGGG